MAAAERSGELVEPLVEAVEAAKAPLMVS